MLLILNLFKHKPFIEPFNRVIEETAQRLGFKSTVITLEQLHTDPDTERFTKMIISGSELSALDDHEAYHVVEKIIRKFVENKKPALGICFGHQFLVRALAGRKHLRKSPVPEFGWAKIVTEENPLLKDISGKVFMVSHFDEVYDLPEDFRVFAQSSACSVHAFQYRDLPVWGVQFHPEYAEEEAKDIFDRVFEKEPAARKFLIDERPGGSSMIKNRKVLENFLKT